MFKMGCIFVMAEFSAPYSSLVSHGPSEIILICLNNKNQDSLMNRKFKITDSIPTTNAQYSLEHANTNKQKCIVKYAVY